MHNGLGYYAVYSARPQREQVECLFETHLYDNCLKSLLMFLPEVIFSHILFASFHYVQSVWWILFTAELESVKSQQWGKYRVLLTMAWLHWSVAVKQLDWWLFVEINTFFFYLLEQLNTNFRATLSKKSISTNSPAVTPTIPLSPVHLVWQSHYRQYILLLYSIKTSPLNFHCV